MEELLRQVNAAFDNCMADASEETVLQLKIIKNNINTLFAEHVGGESVDAEPAVIANTEKISNRPVDGKKILIVDDSSIVRNYLEKILATDYNIEMLNDGQEAINRLGEVEDSEDIALILLDLMMPNVDGFGVLEYMSGRKLQIPVIVITGDNSQDSVTKAFQYGIADMIEKPFDANKIHSKIKNII